MPLPVPLPHRTSSSSFSTSMLSADRILRDKTRQNSFLDAPEVSQVLQATLSEDGYDDDETLLSDREDDRERRQRWFLLACACCFGIGAHYSSHVLAPLKSSLGTSESGFSSLIASFQLMNTITPLLSGFLVPRFGAARCGMIATGLVATGQAIVMFSGPKNLYVMVAGLALFGAGVSPLAVVQETILSQIAPKSSRITNKTIAGGLLLGKAASWFAAILAVPLQRISPQLPFTVAFCLSLFSFLACVLYAYLEKGADITPIGHGQRRLINLKDPPTYGDPFWLYVLVCTFAGGWHTFIHLSNYIIETLYNVSPGRAAANASLILFSSPFLYPLVGWTLDRRTNSLAPLYYAAIGLTCLTFVLLLMAPLIPIVLAILPSALGIGAGPLLIVVIVPRIVERHQISTALGIHKSVEMASGVVFQTFASLILAAARTPFDGSYLIVWYFFVLFFLQLVAVFALWRMVYRRASLPPSEPITPTDEDEDDDSITSLDLNQEPEIPGETTRLLAEQRVEEGPKGGELLRGKVGMALTLILIVVSWLGFFINLFR